MASGLYTQHVSCHLF